ncbi:DUF7848 domain-containing protein [Streptomyces sp. LE64]|uniref:DUF7848 domain-containing protein n=1 Tax=unclassified Streptomyces TaxID=2593676 RepID=UPI003322F054
MTRSVIKHVTYELHADLGAEEEYEARCVWGEEVECGAESGPRHSPEEVTAWMIRHTSGTRHNRYRRTRSDYQFWQPTEHVPAPAPVVAPGPARVTRARP